MIIQSLEDGSFAKVIYQEAEEKGWHGLGSEVKEICQELNIEDLNKRIKVIF